MPREFLYLTATGEVRGDSTSSAFTNRGAPPGFSIIIDPAVAPGTTFGRVQDSSGNDVSGVIYDGIEVRNATAPEIETFYDARDANEFSTRKQGIKQNLADRDKGYMMRLMMIASVQFMNEIIAGRTDPITRADVLAKLQTIIDGMDAD